MTRVLDGDDFARPDEFVAALNKARLAAPKSWMTYVGKVAGLEVSIKTYGCGYLQIFRIDGIEQAAPMDMKPAAWKDFIQGALERKEPVHG